MPEENLFFIISPKDVVVSRLRDMDDHIAWLMDHERYEVLLFSLVLTVCVVSGWAGVLCVCACVYVCVWCVCVRVYVCACLCVCVCACVCLLVCVCACVCFCVFLSLLCGKTSFEWSSVTKELLFQDINAYDS